MLRWEPIKSLRELRTEDIIGGGVPFAHDGYWYQSMAESLGAGGMGTAVAMFRCPAGSTDLLEDVVGKVFQADYIQQLRTDTITRGDHQVVLRNLSRMTALEHPHLLPTFVASPIADNFLYVSPRLDATLSAAIHQHGFTAAKKIELLSQALRAVEAMHQRGMIHRDLTLRNILVDGERTSAYLFDFDLSLHVDDLAGATYRERYKGRIFGSPGYSVPPEVLDEVLMDLPISKALDIYSAGSALFNLFSDELPYGKAEDLWDLLLQIAEGVVFRRHSRIAYPDAVPHEVRPIIDGCLERNPSDRFTSITHVLAELEDIEPRLREKPHSGGRITITAAPGRVTDSTRLSSITRAGREHGIAADQIARIDAGLATVGYQIHRSLGRVKDRPIFLVRPIEALIARGDFPDSNTYPKIVTALEADTDSDLVDLWMGGYLPILRSVRQGLLTSLHRVYYERQRGLLFLFSEYVDDARFGTDLENQKLTLVEAFGLGFLVAIQVQRLHLHGMAHNNISPHALLLKGLKRQRTVVPAMVGLVDPSLVPTDIAEDIEDLAKLIAQWIRQTSLDAAEETTRARLVELWSQLKATSQPTCGRTANVSDVIEVMADALSVLDYNFGVLRESDGDLEAYAVLLLSHRLYPRLWAE